MRFALAALGLAIIAWIWCATRPPQPLSEMPAAAVQKVTGQPVQEMLADQRQIDIAKGHLNLLARYEITARILRRKNYRHDKSAVLSPVDLALGWGPMASHETLSRLSIRQSGRFYSYHWKDAPPIPRASMAHNSANVHIIPANRDAKKAISRLKKNQIVTLRGYLVAYQENVDGRYWSWRSSLSRTDQGQGACEVFYVEEVETY